VSRSSKGRCLHPIKIGQFWLVGPHRLQLFREFKDAHARRHTFLFFFALAGLPGCKDSRFRVALGLEDKGDITTDRNELSWREGYRIAGKTPPIDESAVGTAEILNEEVVATAGQARVLPGDLWIIDDQIHHRIAADGHGVRCERKLLPGFGPFAHGELIGGGRHDSLSFSRAPGSVARIVPHLAVGTSFPGALPSEQPA
jgi:hypothetical protein